MPIKEESFRIGCGRYLQGKGYISRIGEEVVRIASSPLVVGGVTALSLTREGLCESISKKCNNYEFITHTSSCNKEDAEALSLLCRERGYDVIVGVGGGVVCDFAKLVADTAHLPVINVPTSSATCASYTPLSVCYTKEGRTVGTSHFKHEVDAVIVDTEIVASQPTRLFLAGVFDALAKFCEISHRYSPENEEYPLGLDFAYFMSVRSYDFLTSKLLEALHDMEKGIVSETLERMIFTTVCATGVISGIARGSNQTALAHKFYEAGRRLYPTETKPFLHGEIVGVGLLLQNHFLRKIEENLQLIELMKSYNMPYKPSLVGISDTSLEEMYNDISHSSAIDHENEDECRRFRESLEYLYSIK